MDCQLQEHSAGALADENLVNGVFETEVRFEERLNWVGYAARRAELFLRINLHSTGRLPLG